MDKWITIKEAAKLYGMNEQTLRERVHSRRVPVEKRKVEITVKRKVDTIFIDSEKLDTMMRNWSEYHGLK